MGLIKAGLGALGGTLADQWKEFFYCESLPNNVLIKKGQKRAGRRSSNTKGDENVITSGSTIAVADGQCMIIVEQGRVVEVCAEPGEFVFDSSTEPTIFCGSLGKGIEETFKTVGKRFTYGGEAAKDQRIYYFNMKELTGKKFGTRNPVSFRVVDSKISFDMDLSLRCSGTYSYRIVDPLLLYTNVAGNVTNEFTCAELDDQLKEEFISALQPGLGRLSELELRPNQLISHTRELEEAMKAELSADWTERRGLAIVKIALSSVTIPPEESELLKEAQKNAQKARFLTDPSIAGATLVGAQADALKAAASNTAGAMTGFMGMNMAMNAGGMGGGMNAADFFAMGQQQKQQQAQQQKVQQPAANSWTCSCGATATGKFCPECGSKKPEPKMQAGWKCSCGATATGKFCPECGSKKPADDGWTCSCGAVNKGKFCPECGARKPAGVPQYKCDKCGWEPVKGVKPPRFCPECGDPFDDGDLV